MGRLVIAAYQPRPGQADTLRALVRRHGPLLRAEGLATDRPFTAFSAADGTLLELFEWTSAEAIEQAHANPRVQLLWAEFGHACEYRSLASLAESQQLFAEFTPCDDLVA